jgi:hypothetical protein
LLRNEWALLKGLGAAAAVGALLMLGVSASAQDAKKAPKAAPTPTSACKGLDDGACKGKSAECNWIVPKKGKQKPYCRSKPKSAAKKK